MNAKIAEGGDRARAMEVFAAVIDKGSFSAAGRLLGLTPSAVSRTIDRIEARLGARLLLRSTRALAMTADGEAYYHAARRILADLTEVEQAIGEQAAPRGRLRVSTTLSYGRTHVVPLLGEFLDLYPAILVDISLTDTVIDLVEERADVAIRIGPLPDSPLIARRLGESDRVVIASPAYLARRGIPAEPEELLAHRCLGFNFRRRQPWWPFARAGEVIELPITPAIEANNGDTVVQLAMDGVGIARVGRFNVADALADGRLVELLPAYNPGDIEPFHALFLGGSALPARVRVFIDFLAERLGGRDGNRSKPAP